MAQYARPDADDTDGGWVTQNNNNTDLYASVDEASADDGTTHIKVSDEGMGDDACILRLSDVDEPDSGNAYIKYRAVTTDDSWSGAGVPLKLELLETDSYTVRATTTNYSIETDGSTYTNYSYTISDVSGISDWTDLYIRLTMVSGTGMGDTIYVTQVYLETQNAAAEEATANPAFLLFLD